VDPLDKHNFDYIVNCTGLGARELLNDKNVFTISDDIVKVCAEAIHLLGYKRNSKLELN
jgi:hypothetical protein